MTPVTRVSHASLAQMGLSVSRRRFITAQGGVVYFEPNAFLDPASLDRSQQF